MGSRTPLRLASLALLAFVAPAAVVGPAAAQVPQADVPQYGFGLGVSFAIGLVVNLVLGGIVVAVAPDYLRTIVDDIRDSPGEMALYGLLAIVGGFVALIALAITIVGLVVAVPGAIVFGLYLGVTSLMSTIAVGYLLLDSVSDATLWTGLLVGALLSAAFAVIPVVGGIANFVVGLFGTGAVSVRLYRNYRG